MPLSNEALRQLLHIPADEAITRSALLGIMAVREALRSAGVSPKEVPMAFVNGTTVGGMDCSEQYYLDFLNNDSRNEFIALHDVGACTRQIAEHIGPFVYQASTSTACSSAANAIIHAARMLECGEAEMAVAGGTECLTKFHLNGFNSLLILDNAPCRPFCKTRAGLNLGEGRGLCGARNTRGGATPRPSAVGDSDGIWQRLRCVSPNGHVGDGGRSLSGNA